MTHGCSKAELADILEISEPMVDRYRRSGLFTRHGRGVYDLKTCVRNYYENKYGEKDQGTLTEEKTRLTKAQADTKELELQRERGLLIRTDEAIREWGKVVQTVRSKLLAMPTKAASLVVGTRNIPEAQDILERMIHEVLKQLANPKLDKPGDK